MPFWTLKRWWPSPLNVFETALAVGLKAGLKTNQTGLTYTRAGFDPVTLNGSQGKKLFKIQAPGRPVVIVKSVDWFIQVADLEIDGSPATPERNDVIKRTIGSNDYFYKVLPLGGEIPYFEYTDTGQTVFRIHTKFDTKAAV